MTTIIDIRWHNLEPSTAVESEIKKRFAKLLDYADDITTARISINQPHHPSRKPHAFQVLLEVHIPGTIVISQQPATTQGPLQETLDIYLLIHHAFDAVRRQVLDHNRLQQGRSKQHAAARLAGDEPDWEATEHPSG